MENCRHCQNLRCGWGPPEDYPPHAGLEPVEEVLSTAWRTSQYLRDWYRCRVCIQWWHRNYIARDDATDWRRGGAAEATRFFEGNVQVETVLTAGLLQPETEEPILAATQAAIEAGGEAVEFLPRLLERLTVCASAQPNGRFGAAARDTLGDVPATTAEHWAQPIDRLFHALRKLCALRFSGVRHRTHPPLQLSDETAGALAQLVEPGRDVARRGPTGFYYRADDLLGVLAPLNLPQRANEIELSPHAKTLLEPWSTKDMRFLYGIQSLEGWLCGQSSDLAPVWGWLHLMATDLFSLRRRPSGLLALIEAIQNEAPRRAQTKDPNHPLPPSVLDVPASSLIHHLRRERF